MAIISSIPITIKFYVLMAPMFILSGFLWQTFFTPNLKAPLYILGSLLTTVLGRACSSSFPNRVPGFRKNAKLSDEILTDNSQMFDPACNIIENGKDGWGTFYSSPEPHALFFAFTFVYLTAGMFLNQQFNWYLMGFLIAVILSSAFFRTTAPLLCANPVDLFFGYTGGIICGLLWYVIIYFLENISEKPLNLTYFNNTESNAQKCKVEKKKFVCSKKKKV